MTFKPRKRSIPDGTLRTCLGYPPGRWPNYADIGYMRSPATDELESSPGSSSAPAEGSTGKRVAATATLLVVTAATFSYLIAYAVTNALVSAGVLSHWPADTDPRPRRALIIFVALVTTFLIGAVIARVSNRRQMREIDAMMDETSEAAEEELSREAA